VTASAMIDDGRRRLTDKARRYIESYLPLPYSTATRIRGSPASALRFSPPMGYMASLADTA
jgi:hypothetical protein